MAHIIGTVGKDVLDGGAGTLAGGAGGDTYYFDNSGDAAVETAGGGTDNVITIESYTLGDNIEICTAIGGTRS